MLVVNTANPRPRFVVKLGLTFSQVKPSNCYRRLENLVLLFTFDTSLSPLMWNLQSYPAIVWMKECDIFSGSKHTLTPPVYFQGVRTANPHDLRSCWWVCWYVFVCVVFWTTRLRRVCFQWVIVTGSHMRY